MLSEKTLQRLNLLMPRLREWDARSTGMPAEQREEFSMMLAATFPEFVDFAELGFKFLGFNITEEQRDIARYMQHSPQKAMVQAQRGEAKSTLAALFAVWTIIQNNSARVLVVSAGEKQASDIAVLITRLIDHWALLCYLRPDTSMGDRSSFEKYDVHYSLRGVDKSASVACLGITANLPGNRADLLIADDIETPKNSMTQPMRDMLLVLSKEFTAIASAASARILYLGTPQTKDSVYKSLIGRGFSIRIWPGRYPTNEELERYSPGTVAPFVLDALRADPALQTGGGLSGKRGQPTDPQMFGEAQLCEKELDYGEEGFTLQYMLDTTLSDERRTRIKLSDFIFFGGNAELGPERMLYEASERTRLRDLPWNAQGCMLYGPGLVSEKYSAYTKKLAVIDPAGNGGDEVAFACGGALNSYVHVFTVGGLRGGMSEENMDKLFDVFDEFGITDVHVEANMGWGVVSKLLIAHAEKKQRRMMAFLDYPAKGQKERRIIDTIGPVSRRHKLVVHTRAIEDDKKYSELHPQEKRTATSVLYQLSSITYTRGCLAHDDRADCVAKVVQECADLIAVDDAVEEAKRTKAAQDEWLKNPMGYPSQTRNTGGGTMSRLNRRI